MQTTKSQALRRLAVVRLEQTTEKANQAPPNYRSVESMQNCSTCRAYSGGKCMRFGKQVSASYKCDSYTPETAALRNEAMKHLKGKHDQREHSRDRSSEDAQSSAAEDQQSSAAATPGKGRKRPSTRHKAALPYNPDLQSTQLNMPADISARARLFASGIPTADLATDGIETDSHVTAFFGLVPSDELAEKVQQIARTTPPITIQLGALSLFTDNEDFDVLKVDADSPDLRVLNQRLSRLPNENTRTSYNPHMTIAYMTKGRGAKYVGDTTFNGRSALINSLVLSRRDPDDPDKWVQVSYPLLGEPEPKQPLSENDIVRIKEAAMKRLTVSTAAPISFGFGVMKDSAGNWRWVSISSNAYLDRDREIVSEKALTEDVAYADMTKEYGPLRWWHMRGVDIGDCDFNAMHGRMLIESGTFRTKAIGARVAEVAPNYQISIGFRHPPDQPDSNGVYKNIRRFERSLVPAGMVANPFTRIIVKEQDDMNNTKIEALKTLLGEAGAAEILGGATAAEKQANDMGVAFKDVNLEKLAQSDPEAFLQFAVKNFDTAQAKAKEGKAKMNMEEDEDMEEDEGEEETMKSVLKSIVGRLDAIERTLSGTAVSQTTKESTEAATVALSQASALQSSKIGEIETTVKELTQKLNGAMEQLAEARKEANVQPAAFEQGYRPTADASTVNATKEAKTEGNPANPAGSVETGKAVNYPNFINFLSGGYGNGVNGAG